MVADEPVDEMVVVMFALPVFVVNVLGPLLKLSAPPPDHLVPEVE